MKTREVSIQLVGPGHVLPVVDGRRSLPCGCVRQVIAMVGRAGKFPVTISEVWEYRDGQRVPAVEPECTNTDPGHAWTHVFTADPGSPVGPRATTIQ